MSKALYWVYLAGTLKARYLNYLNIGRCGMSPNERTLHPTSHFIKVLSV